MESNTQHNFIKGKSLAILLLVFFSKDLARLSGELSKAVIGYAGVIFLSSTEAQRLMFSTAKVADWLVISAITLAIFWQGLKLVNMSPGDIGLSKPRSIWPDVLLALSIALAVLPAIALYKSAWEPLAAIKAITHASLSPDFINFISGNNWAVIFKDKLNPATLLVLGPFTEELLCTGLLYSVLQKKYPTNTAILITALVFTLPHSFRLAVNIDFLAPSTISSNSRFFGIGIFALFQFIHSAISCKIKDFRGSIWPAIFLHTFMNFITAYLFLE
jgi:membrane protease YdiL (CAAX protease family)